MILDEFLGCRSKSWIDVFASNTPTSAPPPCYPDGFSAE